MIKTELQSNNLDLRALLNAINNLPEKGSGSGEDISEELTAQDALISEISLALDEVAIAGADVFAAIGVTYPEGSICTCSNGTKTLTAKDTSGQALFLIPEAGEWAVTATQGANTKSQSVSITKEGQFESVELSYQLVLFDNGAMVTPMSMGLHSWGNGGQATLEFTDVISMDSPTYSSLSAMTDKKIDITPYKTMYVTVIEFSGGDYFDNWLLVDTKRDREVYNYGNTPTGFAGVGAASSVGTHSLDVSSINGEYYLGIGCGSKGTVKASKVWFE